MWLKSAMFPSDSESVEWHGEPRAMSPGSADAAKQMWHERGARAGSPGNVARATAGTGFYRKESAMYRTRKGGFTLVEILIVVIILGILAAIVIPQFTSASQDARKNSLASQLQTVRSQIELYKLQHLDNLPSDLIASSPNWDQFTNKSDKFGATGTTTDCIFGPYLQAAPTNPLNGSTSVKVIGADVAGGDASNSTADGFLLNSVNGKIWGTSAKYAHVYDEGNPANSLNDQ
jgi:general secretion pathway protein G